MPKPSPHTKSFWLRTPLALALLLLTICVSGCASDRVAKSAVQLPGAPSFMAAIDKPSVKVGDDARLALKKTSLALDSANGRLTQSRGWYLGVKKRYGAARL